jgi:ribosomal protein L37AE/L43A
MRNCECCGALDEGKLIDGIFICRECGRKAATALNKRLTQREIVDMHIAGELRTLVCDETMIDNMKFDLMMRR